MQTQEKFTAAMRRLAEARDLDLIVDTSGYSNVGTYAFQRRDSFDPILFFPFNFQGAKASFVAVIGGSDPGPLGPRHEETSGGFSGVEGDDFDKVVLRIEEVLDGSGALLRPRTPIYNAKYHRDGGTEFVMVTKGPNEDGKFTIVKENGDVDFVPKGDLSSFVPQATDRIVVLNDGTTFSEVEGADVYDVPETWNTEQVEGALGEEALEAIGASTVETVAQAREPIVSLVFTRADIDSMAKERSIDPEVAWARAQEWAKGITETNTARINEALFDAIGTPGESEQA